MSVEAVTDKTFEVKVTKSKGLVFVDFWAEWCGPCKALAPQYEELSEVYEEATFLKADTGVSRKTAKEAGIRSIPTIIAFRDGVEVGRHAGSQGLENFVTDHYIV